MIDDLEHALLASGAIVPSTHKPLPTTEFDLLYETDAEAWILERAKLFRRPGSSTLDNLMNGVTKSLGLGKEENETIEGDIVVSAPGKVILFGEHAVVHGVVRT